MSAILYYCKYWFLVKAAICEKLPEMVVFLWRVYSNTRKSKGSMAAHQSDTNLPQCCCSGDNGCPWRCNKGALKLLKCVYVSVYVPGWQGGPLFQLGCPILSVRARVLLVSYGVLFGVVWCAYVGADVTRAVFTWLSSIMEVTLLVYVYVKS